MLQDSAARLFVGGIQQTTYHIHPSQRNLLTERSGHVAVTSL